MPPTFPDLFIAAFGLSLLMIGAAGLLAAALGLPLGMLLYAGDRRLSPARIPGRACAAAGRALRSAPAAVASSISVPVIHHALGGDMGLGVAIVSLTILAAPFLARRVRDALAAADHRGEETARRRGAAQRQSPFATLLSQASPAIARALGLMLAALVGYSSIAGALLGLGLGDLALREGYQQFQPMVMLLAAAALVALAEAAQAAGGLLAARLQNGPRILPPSAAHRLPPR